MMEEFKKLTFREFAGKILDYVIATAVIDMAVIATALIITIIKNSILC